MIAILFIYPLYTILKFNIFISFTIEGCFTTRFFYYRLIIIQCISLYYYIIVANYLLKHLAH